jgi:hypothetical protein
VVDNTNIWLQGLFNALTALGPVGLLLISVWGKLKEQQKEMANAVIAEFAQNLVSKREMELLERRLQHVELTQQEFGVIKVKLEGVERRVTEVGRDVKDTRDQLSNEITGAMDGVRDQIKDNNELMIQLLDAKTGRKP